MKTAIITGASSGMGREFVREFFCRYVNIEEIWIIARREAELNAIKEELESLKMDKPSCKDTTKPSKKHLKKPRIFVLPLDLTKDESMKQYKMALEERKPEVCVLVNSAGYGKIGSFEEVGYEHNRGMVKLNCQALTDVTYLTLPYMRRGGQMIHLASSAAFVPQPEFVVYAATKSYVLSFSRGLKWELADREISVTAVCPGPVKTEFFRVAEEGSDKKLKRLKMLVMADPKKVVRKAIKDARKGKEKSVYGWIMQLFELLCKLVPHKLLLKIMSI